MLATETWRILPSLLMLHLKEEWCQLPQVHQSQSFQVINALPDRTGWVA